MSEEYVDPTMMRTAKSDNPLSFEYIVHDQIWRVIKLQSVDWHGGVYEERPLIAAGGVVTGTIKNYVPSTAKAYSNAVEGLYDLVSAHVTKNVTDAFNAYELEVSGLKTSVDKDTAFLLAKAVAARKLFRVIAVWLKSNNYFKRGDLEDGREEQ
jgi:hypothetical protein